MTGQSTFTQEIALWAVYVLKDEAASIRYVGVTKNPKDRLAQHLREWRGKSTHRANWIGSMVTNGLSPAMEVVEWTEDWDEAERRWIAKCRNDGCQLTNGNAGGKTMHQARSRSEAYPNIKRAYRFFESNIRSLSKRGRPTDSLSLKLELFRTNIAKARATGRLGEIDAALGARLG